MSRHLWPHPYSVSSRTSPLLLTTLGVVVGVAAYLALVFMGRVFEYQHHGATVFWPATGLVLFVVWRYGRTYALIAFLGELLYSLYYQRGPDVAIANALVGTIEVLLAYECMWRLSVSARLRSVRDMCWFIALAVVVPTLVAALGGSAALLAFTPLPASAYWSAVWSWWLGDALGVLVVTPLLAELGHRHVFRSVRMGVLWLITLVITGAAAVLIMHYTPTPAMIFFALLPLTTVGALVAGMRGAASVAAVLAICVLGLRLLDVSEFTLGIRLLFVATSTISGYVLAVALSERRFSEKRLRHQATHDALTGAVNRVAFDDALRAATQAPGLHAVFYMDLDHFKLLNDSQGHDLGDRFLAGLAIDLQAAVGPSGILARLGGDEFAVLADDTTAEAANSLAAMLRDTVRDYTVIEHGLIFSVGVSIGMVLFSQGDDPVAVLRRADIACYSAKAEGSNHIQQSGASEHDEINSPMEIQRVAQFHAALADGRFRLARQLIAPLPLSEGATTEEPPFYEILLRLHDDAGAPTSPGPFLDVATRYGLTPVIDRWVVEQSFRYLVSLDKPQQLSINLFGSTLSDPALYADIAALQRLYGINPRHVVFEVTEQVAIHNMARTVAMMNRFVADGYRFSLDDFGSGMASFGYLQELPIAFVKVDGGFVRDIDIDPTNTVIIETLVKMSAIKNLGCIAEWIENDAILERMNALGVDYGQGFHLHRPELIDIP